MTRLTTDWVKPIAQNLKEYDAKITKLTGMDISSLAFCAAGKQVLSKAEMKNHKVAVVRISTGKGVIGSFAESVAAVIRYMGAEVFIPEAHDVAGIHEAISRDAEILFMADDDRFIAINTKTGVVSENDDAIALGYVVALSAMAEGLSGKEVLQLGFGRLGQKTLERLLYEGAVVSVYDKDSRKTTSLYDDRETPLQCDNREALSKCSKKEIDNSADNENAKNQKNDKDKISGKSKGDDICKNNVHVLTQLPLPLTGLIMDVTNEGGFLTVKDLSEDIKIVAPGLPLLLDDEAYMLYNEKVMHDPLQTGVAVMLAMSL